MNFENEMWCKLGILSEDQANFIRNLVIQKQPKSCLEFGFYNGRTAYSVLSSCESVKVYNAIDVSFDSSNGREMLKLIKGKFPFYNAIGFTPRRILNQPFLNREFGRIEDPGIDLVIVNGDFAIDVFFEVDAFISHFNNTGTILVDYNTNTKQTHAIKQMLKDVKDKHNFKMEEWKSGDKGFTIFTRN